MTHPDLTFPVGSRQDLQSRRLQGAVADGPGWQLNHGSANIPLTAQLYTACTRQTCKYGIHMCAYASVVYWDTLDGGEWKWHVVDSRRNRPGSDLNHPDKTVYADPREAVRMAELGLAAFLVHREDSPS